MSLKSEHQITQICAQSSILGDSMMQEQFTRDGYVKLSFINDSSLLKELTDCFKSFEGAHQLAEGRFHHTTHYTKDWKLIEEVNESILKIIKPALSETFINFSVLGSAFIVKAAGKDTAFTPHQDWTLLDESRYCSANLWIALEDITPHNGALRFLKGSHRIIRNLRMAPNFPPLFQNVMPRVYPHMTGVSLKAGEAVLFDCGILHGSFANLSGKPRISAIVGLYTKEAPFRFYYNTQKGDPPIVDQYNLDPKDYMKFGIGDRPDTNSPDVSFEYRFPQITSAEFDALYPLSFFNKIKKMFGFKPTD